MARKFSVFVDEDLIRDLETLRLIERSPRATIIRKAIEAYVTQRRRAIAAHRRKQAQSEAA